jgi:hypothetical protein
MNIGSISKGYGGEFHKTQTKDRMSSIYQDQRIEPCNLSSSIFYGGQDIIHHVQSTQNERKNLLVSANIPLNFSIMRQDLGSFFLSYFNQEQFLTL